MFLPTVFSPSKMNEDNALRAVLQPEYFTPESYKVPGQGWILLQKALHKPRNFNVIAHSFLTIKNE